MDVKLDAVKGIGPKTLAILRQQGIWSTYDLVLKIPKGYEDFSTTDIRHARHRSKISVKATIDSPLKMIRGQKTERIVFQAKVFDVSVDVVVFGRGYLLKSLALHDEIVIKGTYDLYRNSINASHIVKAEKNVPIKPVYGIEGIHDRSLQTIIEDIFEHDLVTIYERMPYPLIQEKGLVERKKAYQMLHLPTSYQDIQKARLRMKYEEAFFLSLRLSTMQPYHHPRPSKAYDIDLVRSLIQEIPYELTQDQKDAVNDIYRDFKKPRASYRLIQGDVGSGKTIVAIIAMYAVITAKEQVALMAPTALLAQQHFQTVKQYLKSVRVALLTSRTKNKEEIKAQIKRHEIDMVIGTHALIESDVEFAALGLVVIDEQHKFGVNTRDELIKKARYRDVLYLTATPIPRTLALIAYGHNHVSVIKQKPSHRPLIQTRYITKESMGEMIDKIHSAILRKEHIYLVVPAIASDHVTDNIDTVYQMIEKEFFCPIFVLHGRLSEEEKDNMMENFIYTPGSILLSTTMIEVGIDIPTATFIGIFSAEHFGLSQLHQLRGRVGRGHLPSFCYLVSDKNDIERLDVLTHVDDGFKLAAYDLIERGPGDFLGTDQSGFVDCAFLDFGEDVDVMIQMQQAVEKMITEPDFKTNPRYRYYLNYMEEHVKI